MRRALLAVEIATIGALSLAGAPPLRVAFLSLLAVVVAAGGIVGRWIWRDTRQMPRGPRVRRVS